MITPASRDELEAIVAEYHHLREEHRRSRAEGRVRRHAEARLRELQLHFERLLDEWGPRDELHEAWRAHLHRGGPEPAEPAPTMPLVFRGLADSGSRLEVRERADGDCDVAIDGVRVERVAADLDFPGTKAPRAFRLDGLVFRETFAASAAALEALAVFRGRAHGEAAVALRPGVARRRSDRRVLRPDRARPSRAPAMSFATTHSEVAALLARGGDEGRLPLAQVEGLVEELGLDEADTAALYDEIDASGIAVRDDGNGEVRSGPWYGNGELAAATSDSLQLFLNEMARYPLLTESRTRLTASRQTRRGCRRGSQPPACPSSTPAQGAPQSGQRPSSRR